jgi:hypothetical protein
MLAEAKVVAHAWLRSGHRASARGVTSFMAETLARLLADFRLYALRADAGFFVADFLAYLEEHLLPYAIAVRRNPHLKGELAGLRQWRPCAPGLEVAETTDQAYGWKAPRRLVVVREELRERPEARGRRLIEVPGYSFHVLVTTLALDPVQTWYFYNRRADSENRRKQLKEDFGADGFCLQSFDGTEAAFGLICFLFNLIAAFKRDITRDESARLMTVRSRVLVVGAILGADGRKQVLRLGVAPGASALPRCSSASPSWPRKLWRSLTLSAKTQLPGPGNRVRPIANLLYYCRSTEVFGLNLDLKK